MTNDDYIKEFGLVGWKVKTIKSGGGLCLHKSKQILIDENHGEAMILHEIAHALVGEKHGHDGMWGDKLTEITQKALEEKGIEHKKEIDEVIDDKDKQRQVELAVQGANYDQLKIAHKGEMLRLVKSCPIEADNMDDFVDNVCKWKAKLLNKLK